MINRIPLWTILSSLTELCKPLMFAGELAPVDPAPVPTDPAPTDPAPTDPVPTDPAPTSGTNWKDGLDDDIKANPALANFKSVNDVAKSLLQSQKMIGRKGVILPVEGSSQEEIDEFHNAIGRPPKVEGYKIEDIKPPEGVTIDQNARTSFLTTAHGLGLTDKQVNGLAKWELELKGVQAKAESDERNKEIADAETDLRKDWGNAYDANLALADKVIAKFADEKAKDGLSEALGHDPRMIRMMAGIAKGMSEDTLGDGLAIMTKTPGEATAEIEQIRHNKKHPYHNAQHPEHKAALKYMTSLYDMAYPEKKE